MRRLLVSLLLSSLVLVGCGATENPRICLNERTEEVYEPARTELRPKIGGLQGISWDGNPSISSGGTELVFIPEKRYTRTICDEWATPTPEVYSGGGY